MSERNLSGRFLTAAATLLEQDFTADKRADVRRRLGSAEAFMLSANQKDWYPAERVLEVYDALRPAYDSNAELQDAFCRLGKIIADQAANTFMRLFMKVVTPGMLFKQFPKIWPKYADFGTFEMGTLSSNRFEFTVRDLVPMVYFPMISRGWTVYMLESMRKKDIRIDIQPETGLLEAGVSDMEIKAHWS